MIFWYLALSNNCLLFLHLNFWCLLTVSSENGYVGTHQVSVWSFPAFQESQERGNKAGVTEALRTLGKIVFFNSVWEVTWGVKPFYRCLPHHFISFTSSLHEFEVLVSAIFVTFMWLERRKWVQCCTYWDDRVVENLEVKTKLLLLSRSLLENEVSLSQRECDHKNLKIYVVEI